MIGSLLGNVQLDGKKGATTAKDAEISKSVLQEEFAGIKSPPQSTGELFCTNAQRCCVVLFSDTKSNIYVIVVAQVVFLMALTN